MLVEPVEDELGTVADLDEVAVGITHVTAPFPAVIVLMARQERALFVAPLFVAGQMSATRKFKEATYSVQIRRCFNAYGKGCLSSAGDPTTGS